MFILLKFVSIFILVRSINNSDSVLSFPVKNGKIIQSEYDSNSFCKTRIGIAIAPISDFNIYSCTNGKILSISKISSGYLISVKVNHMTYFYSMIDTTFVQQNSIIKQGDIIGTKKHFVSDDNYIIFSVFRDNKEKDPLNFLIYK